MKTKRLCTLMFIILLSAFLPITAYANSSWRWLTKTRPLDILPYAVVITLLIEFVALRRLNSIMSALLLLVVCLANLASFLLPYALYLLPLDVGYTFEMSINHLPSYIVGLGYLILTLIAEIPIIYNCFKRSVANSKRFMSSIVAVNIVTTAIIAGIERIFIRGSW